MNQLAIIIAAGAIAIGCDTGTSNLNEGAGSGGRGNTGGSGSQATMGGAGGDAATSGVGGAGATGGAPANSDPQGPCRPIGSGGTMYVPHCPEWMEEGLAEVRCNAGAGGAGGAGTQPALARLCERGTEFAYRVDIIHCLEPLKEQPCAPDHEARVRACLDGYLHLCGYSNDLCTSIVDACPEVTLGDCDLGLDEYNRDPSYTLCFEQIAANPGDDCRARFMHCAWGL